MLEKLDFIVGVKGYIGRMYPNRLDAEHRDSFRNSLRVRAAFGPEVSTILIWSQSMKMTAVRGNDGQAGKQI